MKVISTKHTLFAANHLVNQLNKLNQKAELVDRVTDNDTYIIYGAFALKELPKNYIVYQTEVSGSTWFNDRYREIIKNAQAVLEYSWENVRAYEHKNIHFVSPGISPQKVSVKNIPMTFYGHLNERRKKLLKGKNVNIVENKFGKELSEILRRTKVVLNIHYYDNAPLEVFRVHEALSFGCHVISEPPEVTEYKNYVSFAETDFGEFNYDLSKLDNLKQIKDALRFQTR